MTKTTSFRLLVSFIFALGLVGVLTLPAAAQVEPYQEIDPSSGETPVEEVQSDSEETPVEEVQSAADSQVLGSTVERSSGRLAFTGVEVGVLVLIGVALIGGGAVFVAGERRRRHSTS